MQLPPVDQLQQIIASIKSINDASRYLQYFFPVAFKEHLKETEAWSMSNALLQQFFLVHPKMLLLLSSIPIEAAEAEAQSRQVAPHIYAQQMEALHQMHEDNKQTLFLRQKQHMKTALEIRVLCLLCIKHSSGPTRCISWPSVVADFNHIFPQREYASLKNKWKKLALEARKEHREEKNTFQSQ